MINLEHGSRSETVLLVDLLEAWILFTGPSAILHHLGMQWPRISRVFSGIILTSYQDGMQRIIQRQFNKSMHSKRAHSTDMSGTVLTHLATGRWSLARCANAAPRTRSGCRRDLGGEHGMASPAYSFTSRWFNQRLLVMIVKWRCATCYIIRLKEISGSKCGNCP